MKKLDLQKIIREEVRRVVKEAEYAVDFKYMKPYIKDVQQAIATLQILNDKIETDGPLSEDIVDALEALGTGSVVSNTQPTTVQEGLLWLDIDSTPGTTPVNPTAIYTAIEPSTPTDGTLWCVKGSSPLLLKIYNSATSDWDTIGE